MENERSLSNIVSASGHNFRLFADFAPSSEYKFHGFPLNPHGEQTVTLQLSFLDMLEVFESFGYNFYGSIGHTQLGVTTFSFRN